MSCLFISSLEIILKKILKHFEKGKAARGNGCTKRSFFKIMNRLQRIKSAKNVHELENI